MIDFEIDATGTIPAPEIPALARQAEAAGFGGVWKGETSNRDPIALLAACAPATERATLGTAILHLLARSPVATGMAAATLAALSGGRFTLGLGVANPTLAGWHGATFAHPLTMARDYLTIVRQTYAGERVSWDGASFAARDFRLGGAVPEAPLRILLAALGPKMSRLAGEIADGILINNATPAAIREIGGWARDAAKRDDFDVVVKFRVAMSDDPAAARNALRPTVAVYCRAAGYRELLARSGFADDLTRIDAAWSAGGFGAAIRAVDDAMLARLPVAAIRHPSELPPLLEEYVDAGATRILVPLIPVGPDLAAETRAFLEGYST
jgi:alkanesulfonate monooxygenase SsuD/methylene tetrahydromethanopterin reductase-like flavin-dependent oxidoreductase (luciferase family)